MQSTTAKKLIWTAALAIAGAASAQTPATPLPHVSGTVKAASADSLTVTGTAGDVAVAVTSTTKILQVPPDSKDLKSATATTADNIAVGDKVIVSGTAGDAATSLHAARVILMKSSAIAQNHATEEAAWQKGGGGLVKSVDASSGAIIIASGARNITVNTTPTTKFNRYSGDSVKFEDAVGSKLSEVRPGDQLRVRGTRSDDGSTIQADAIVTGSFHNFSGLLTAIDGTAGTVTLKDLATKKVVIVKVSANSDVRRIPAAMAARFAARTNGAAAGGAPAGAAPAGPGAGRAGADLSQMLSRLPTETLGGLKVGDAVMIVATQPPSDSANPTAVTLLAGVEPILQASPKGDTVLSPWNMGGGGGAEAGGSH